MRKGSDRGHRSPLRAFLGCEPRRVVPKRRLRSFWDHSRGIGRPDRPDRRRAEAADPHRAAHGAGIERPRRRPPRRSTASLPPPRGRLLPPPSPLLPPSALPGGRLLVRAGDLHQRHGGRVAPGSERIASLAAHRHEPDRRGKIERPVHGAPPPVFEALVAQSSGRRGIRNLRELISDDPRDTEAENERRRLVGLVAGRRVPQ